MSSVFAAGSMALPLRKRCPRSSNSTQSATIGLGVVSAVILKCREDMIVSQTDVGVRVHVAIEIAERRDQGRVQGIAQVEEHGATAFEGIG